MRMGMGEEGHNVFGLNDIFQCSITGRASI